MEFAIEDLEQLQEHLSLLQKYKKDVQLKDMMKETSIELSQLENDYTRDYLKRIQEIIKLHDDVQSMDEILQGMEQEIGTYQTAVSNMNSEISHLYSSSSVMDLKLQNRLKAHQFLAQDLEGIVISPDLVKYGILTRKICEGEVNEFFLHHIHELDAKLEYQVQNEEKGIKALRVTAPELVRLQSKATEKIRDFLLKMVDSLKEPNTNIALIQQNLFIKYKELFWFLMVRNEPVGLEVHQNYISTVSSYFVTQFEKYTKSLSRFQLGTVEKTDLIGSDERRAGGLFAKAVVKEATQIFGLGNRVHVLTLTDAGIIVPHHAEEQNKRFNFEAIFKSLNRLLIDNACSEYVFTCEFFNKDRKQHVDSLQMFFLQVFDPTLKCVLVISNNLEYN
jgi:vacuolar protein sorting-associated protein 52